jgi:hypothetical protein
VRASRTTSLIIGPTFAGTVDRHEVADLVRRGSPPLLAVEIAL